MTPLRFWRSTRCVISRLCFCCRSRRFLWFWRRRSRRLGFAGRLAPFVFADLRTEDTGEDCARRECRCEREISGVVTIVSRHVQLKNFCGDDPAEGKENRAWQRLTDG